MTPLDLSIKGAIEEFDQVAAVNPIQQAIEALALILPMAKGYAHQHPVGNNSAFCDQADAALSALQSLQGVELPPLPDPVTHQFLEFSGEQMHAYARTAVAAAMARGAVPQEVLDALFDVDDYIARVNGDDRGSSESVNVLRRFLESLAAAPEAPAQADWRKCDFCGCNTNAKARACCERGKRADAAPTQPTQAEAPSEREALNEIDLVISVLRGYPMSMARDDALRASHKVRAALASQPQAEAVPSDWPAELSSNDRTQPERFAVVDEGGLWIDDDDFKFDALINVSGDFGDDDTKRKYLEEMVRRLNGRAPTQASQSQAEAPATAVVQVPQPAAEVLRAAKALIAKIGDNLGDKPWPQKYGVPYAEANALRLAIDAAVDAAPEAPAQAWAGDPSTQDYASTQPTQAEAPSEREALPTLPFAVFDEFGTPCEDRVRDHFRAALATQQAGQGEAVAINYVILHDFAQRKRVSYNELCVAVNDAIKSMATPPTPQQPEALAQQERDGEDADYLCKLVDAIGRDVLGVLKQYGDAQAAIGLMASRTKEAIRAARSSEGGSND